MSVPRDALASAIALRKNSSKYLGGYRVWGWVCKPYDLGLGFGFGFGVVT